MILLEVTRLNNRGAFSYAIERIGQGSKFTTLDPAAAARRLSKMGVKDPDPLVAHARNWGFVEIVDRRPLDPQE